MDTTLIQVILANVFQVVEGGLVMLVTGIAGIVLHKLAVKFHLSNEADLKSGLDYALNKAVHGAEAWADSHKTAPTGSEKMDEAIKIARMLLTNETFKQFTDAQLKKLVEAALSAEQGLVATNASPEASTVVVTAPAK